MQYFVQVINTHTFMVYNLHTHGNKFEITLLIGIYTDLHWNFVQDKGIGGNDPTAVESRMGYLLFGPLSLIQACKCWCFSYGSYAMWGHKILGHKASWYITQSTLASNQRKADQTFYWLFNSSGWVIHCWISPGSLITHHCLQSIVFVSEKRVQFLACKLVWTLDAHWHHNSGGFIEGLKNSELYVVPHYAVKEESATTLVHDYSCCLSIFKTSRFEQLPSGWYYILIDMCTLLLRFQTHWLALTTNIEKGICKRRLQMHSFFVAIGITWPWQWIHRLLIPSRFVWLCQFTAYGHWPFLCIGETS